MNRLHVICLSGLICCLMTVFSQHVHADVYHDSLLIYMSQTLNQDGHSLNEASKRSVILGMKHRPAFQKPYEEYLLSDEYLEVRTNCYDSVFRQNISQKELNKLNAWYRSAIPLHVRDNMQTLVMGMVNPTEKMKPFVEFFAENIKRLKTVPIVGANPKVQTFPVQDAYRKEILSFLEASNSLDAQKHMMFEIALQPTTTQEFADNVMALPEVQAFIGTFMSEAVVGMYAVLFTPKEIHNCISEMNKPLYQRAKACEQDTTKSRFEIALAEGHGFTEWLKTHHEDLMPQWEKEPWEESVMMLMIMFGHMPESLNEDEKKELKNTLDTINQLFEELKSAINSAPQQPKSDSARRAERRAEAQRRFEKLHKYEVGDTIWLNKVKNYVPGVGSFRYDERYSYLEEGLYDQADHIAIITSKNDSNICTANVYQFVNRKKGRLVATRQVKNYLWYPCGLQTEFYPSGRIKEEFNVEQRNNHVNAYFAYDRDGNVIKGFHNDTLVEVHSNEQPRKVIICEIDSTQTDRKKQKIYKTFYFDKDGNPSADMEGDLYALDDGVYVVVGNVNASTTWSSASWTKINRYIWQQVEQVEKSGKFHIEGLYSYKCIATLDQSGKVKSVTTTKSTSVIELDLEAARIVRSMPQWEDTAQIKMWKYVLDETKAEVHIVDKQVELLIYFDFPKLSAWEQTKQADRATIFDQLPVTPSEPNLLMSCPKDLKVGDNMWFLLRKQIIPDLEEEFIRVSKSQSNYRGSVRSISNDSIITINIYPVNDNSRLYAILKVKILPNRKLKYAGTQTRLYPSGKVHEVRVYNNQYKLASVTVKDSLGNLVRTLEQKAGTRVDKQYHTNGQIRVERVTEGGETTARYFDKAGRQVSYLEGDLFAFDDGVYVIAGNMPAYPGGEAAMMDYIQNNTRPRGVKNKSVLCSVHIKSDGSIGEVRIKESSGILEVDEEAVRVLKSMPKWNPGTIKKWKFVQNIEDAQIKVIKTTFTISVPFDK